MSLNPIHSTSDAPPVVEILNLDRSFGAKQALDGVSLSVPRGSVFGLIGENGAGKTTLIRHILGLLKAQHGSVRVFGLDPVTNPAAVLSRIGYLSEEGDLPGWMRVGELIRYLQPFYPRWDAAYAEELRQTFDLNPRAKIKSLSKGQRSRVGLLAALAHRPDLLLLDEPSSGLDPIVRQEILIAILRAIAEEGRTVIFSSHLLDEVDRTSDRIAMIRRGRLVFSGELDDVKLSHTRFTLHFAAVQDLPPAIDGAFAWDGGGHEWSAMCDIPIERIEVTAAALGAVITAHRAVSLEEIFIARSQRPRISISSPGLQTIEA